MTGVTWTRCSNIRLPQPDSTAGQRFASTVSQQALFMLNSPIVADLSHRIVNRPEFTNIADDRTGSPPCTT